MGTAVFAGATEGTATLELATSRTNGKYGPKHVLASWVTDANTNFVKTICRYASKRQRYLTTWTTARGQESSVDGVTGATMPAHQAMKLTWDGCDAAHKPMPDGTYLLFVEFTDAHRQGPLAAFPVQKGSKPLTNSFPDQENFKSITLTFTPQVEKAGRKGGQAGTP